MFVQEYWKNKHTKEGYRMNTPLYDLVTKYEIHEVTSRSELDNHLAVNKYEFLS